MPALLELGNGRARTDRRYAHTRAAKLEGDRFAEGEDECLGGIVNRHVRAGLKAGGRGDVENAAAASGDHGRQKECRQMDERGDIDLDHVELSLQVELVEITGQAKAGVVDQRVDANAFAA